MRTWQVRRAVHRLFCTLPRALSGAQSSTPKACLRDGGNKVHKAKCQLPMQCTTVCLFVCLFVCLLEPVVLLKAGYRVVDVVMLRRTGR